MRFIRKFIAVGQKISADEKWGSGFNYWVEARFPFSAPKEKCVAAFGAVLNELDHKALGVDVVFDAGPDSAALCRIIHQRLEEHLKVKVEVVLERGDGWTYRTI